MLQDWHVSAVSKPVTPFTPEVWCSLRKRTCVSPWYTPHHRWMLLQPRSDISSAHCKPLRRHRGTRCSVATATTEHGSCLPSSGWPTTSSRVFSCHSQPSQGLERVPWQSHHQLSLHVSRAGSHGQAGMLLHRENAQGELSTSGQTLSSAASKAPGFEMRWAKLPFSMKNHS